MPTRSAAIAPQLGLHARTATVFARMALAAGIPITVTKGNTSVNAASMLAVMALGVRRGEEVTLSAEGEGADEVLAQLVAFLESDHDAIG
ncbi:HPr family phosphocarrier protein [Tessaracoccus sp.]